MPCDAGFHSARSVYSELLIDDHERVWQRLDRAYKPFAHGQAPRGGVKENEINEKERSASVSDWISLAWDGRPKSDQARLDASLGVLARFLRFPKVAPSSKVREQGMHDGEGYNEKRQERRQCPSIGSHIVKSDAKILWKWEVRGGRVHCSLAFSARILC